MARGDFPSAKQDQFMVRMPDGLRDRIRAHATANNRSMNAEVISLLEMALFDADRAERPIPGMEALKAEYQKVEDLLLKMDAKLNRLNSKE